MIKRKFPLKKQNLYFHSKHSIYSNNIPLTCHHVWGQKCSTFRLNRARVTFLWWKLSIKATFIITSALSTTCAQRPAMVFLLPTLRYWPFDLWYEGFGQRNFVSGNCVKGKWLLPQEQLFQTAMQSTLLTLQILIQLPQIHFLTHAPHSTVNGYIQILVLWKVSSKIIFSKHSCWEGQQH